MSLDSVLFLLGFIPFLILYYLIRDKTGRKVLILAASTLFIAYADIDFLIIALLFSIANFLLGKSIIAAVSEQRKRLIYISGIVLNILGLALYKYVDFITFNLNDLFFDGRAALPYLHIILPLGISYYTFQSIGYLFDVYHENDDVEESFLDFSIFLLFFPKFVGGPIERGYNFLPQLKDPSTQVFDTSNFKSGLRLFTWGLFKKVVVSTALWKLISPAYADIEAFHGITLLMVAFIYPFQIYAEFSGYTDMALGAARMMGLKLSPNFNAPFTATSISDFWRRWHISLSTWVSDYIYTPLSMKIALTKDWGKMGIILAMSSSFLILGIWHGAQWTYIAFGAIQAIFISYEIMTRKQRGNWKKKYNVKVYNRISNIITIGLYAISCIFFGVKTMSEGFLFIQNMLSGIVETLMAAIQNTDLARQDILYLGMEANVLFKAMALFGLFMLIQRWIDRKGLDELLNGHSAVIRWASYYAIVGMIFFNSNKAVSFLYGTF